MELRCSGGKRVSRINKSFSVVCSDKMNAKSLCRFCWTHFFLFQLFVVMFVMPNPAWAGLTNLSVDANGDAVFNGDNEKLTITFTTSDYGEEDQGYTYIIMLSDGRKITGGPDNLTGQTLQKNQTIEYIWDGTVETNKQGERVALTEGLYTVHVILRDINDNEDINVPSVLPDSITTELTTDATLDKTKPVIDDVSVGYSEFSPIFDSTPVYYTLSEDVAEAWIEIQRAAGGGSIGRRIGLNTSQGSHTFYWHGDDGNRRSFEDGNYRLRLVATDKGGNTAEPKTTEQITIDSAEPTITGMIINDSIPIVDGSFVNASIQTIGFTADAGGGTPLNFDHRDTEIRIRPVGGNNLRGALTVTGNNKATFTLGNTLDDFLENGIFEVTAFVSDRVGNLTSARAKFTFDNAAPTLKSIYTNSDEVTPGSGLEGMTNYVEAELEDNIELDLPASSIRLTGPDGNLVLGKQTLPANNRIRWELRSPLLARDGIHDGQYNVEIVGTDKANNRTETINISFLFDNLAPKLVSLQPTRNGASFDFLGDTIYYNLPLNQFVATFNDGEHGTGVIFSGAQDVTSIIFGTPKSDEDIEALSGRMFPDMENSVLTYILNSPILKTDGSQDGTYLVAVKAADLIGNINTTKYQIIYDTQVPTLRSTVPAANQTVSSLSEVVVTLNEATSGIDFIQSNFRLLYNEGDNEVEVPVNIASNGTDTVTLTLLQEIAIDGSNDGTYTIEITPSDNAGNIGGTVRRQFYLVSKTQPRLRLTTPETGTVNNLGDIAVVIDNYIGTGINFSDSTIVVSDENGGVVSGSKVEHDAANNQLTWSTETSLPRNGTADGEYSILVVYVDFSGNRYSQSFPLNLDTQYPSINKVEVGTNPQQQLSIESLLDVNETFSKISVDFVESDVDFENTSVSLAGPDGSDIALHRSNDGGSVLTLNFQSLSRLGTYTFTVAPTDNIGNVSQNPFVYKFDLDIAVPVVTSVLIGDQSGAVVYVNDSAGEIIADLVDTTGTGLAVGEGESDIVVTSEIGIPVPGITTINDANQLIWRPVALPKDGSGDGRYTVAVTPVDNAGRIGDVAFRSFIYDTQVPRVNSASPISLHQPISYIGGSLSSFQLAVEDVGPALLDLDAQSISLQKVDGEVVSGHTTHDGVNQVFFTLSAPLPSDGSADGEYELTVSLIDRAGNSHQIQHSIFYDSQVPVLSTVSLNTETPLDLSPYQVTDLVESVSTITVNFVDSTRVDFANTTITLMGPDGSDIPFNLENNGIDQLTASFVSLIHDGLYTLSVTAQDIVGNSAQGAVPYPFRVQFELPRLSSVKAIIADTSVDLIQHEIVDIVDVINQVTLDFTDATRLDFENTKVELLDPNGQQIPLTQEENDTSQLIVRFISITQSGLYTLNVTPQDIAGNVPRNAARYQFRLDIALPSVSSLLIDGQLSSKIYVHDAITTIVATFIEPAGVGLDFSDDGSSIVVTNQNGVELTGITDTNELNQLTWVPLAIPTDGSADGTYNVSVTPIDKVGRTGKIVNRQFIFDTQAPRITAASPVDLHQPTTYIGGNLTQFQISIQDEGPAMLDLDAQTITLHNSDGAEVAGQTTHDGVSQLYFTLPTALPMDGSSDGKYTLSVDLVDNAGNSHQSQYNIFYDSQAPSITSVFLNTQTPLDLTPYKVTELSETVSKLTLGFDESTQVDFENTNVTLTGPDGSSILLTLTNNGVDELTANFVALTQGGKYTVSVTPRDITGNEAQGAVQFPFEIDFPIPEITSVKATTTNDTITLTPFEIVDFTDEVNSFSIGFSDIMLIDTDETSVTLSGPNGEDIAVTVEEGEDSQLVIRFVSLMESGLYRLSITPQDTLGNAPLSTIQYQFRIELPKPEITSVKATTTNDTITLTPFEIVDFTEAVNSFLLAFSDIMLIDIEDTVVTLSGPNGEDIAVTIEEGEDSALILRFVPLIESGLYRLSITPQDTLGNTPLSTTQYQFRIELPKPEITSVKATTANDTITITPFEIVDFTEAVNSFSIGFSDIMLIDIDETSVTLSGPNGEDIAVTVEEGEDSQLVIRFVSLMESGLYRLSITPQDTLGNTPQSTTQYQFRIELPKPEITSVKANTANDTITITPFEIIDFTEAVNSFSIGFSDVMLIDIDETSVTLSGPNEEDIAVTIEKGEDSQLILRFVSLMESGLYRLSITPQDTLGNDPQSTTQYQFRIELPIPEITSVKANTADDTIKLTPFEIIDFTEAVNSFSIGFSDIMLIEIEDTVVTLSGPNGEDIAVTIEEGEDSQLILRFVSLMESGLYRLSITPQDTLGNAPQSTSQYQFRIEIPTPEITSVKANTTNDTITITPFEIVDFTAEVNSFSIGFSDIMLIDIDETSATLSGPNGEDIAVTIEEGEDSQLILRFVSLMESGLYRLSITPQDTLGNAPQSATQYQFRIELPIPEITSVRAFTTYESITLTSFEIVDFTEAVNSFSIGFSDIMLIDIDETSVTLSGPNGENIAVTIEEGGASQLIVRFVSLMESGLYRLSITPQDTLGNDPQSTTQYQFRIELPIPEISSVKANTTNDTITITPFEIVDFTEAVNSFSIGFSDIMLIDIEDTIIALSGPNGDNIAVTIEEGEDSQLIVRFVSLMESGLYRLSITPQDKTGNAAENATQYQFRIELPIPEITSVKANTTNDTITLSPFEIVDFTEAVYSFALEVSDAVRVDIEDTVVTLTGPNGEDIAVTIEEGEDSQLVIRFVSLMQSGLYRLSIIPQDTLGNAAQTATQYQFRLRLKVPEVTTLNAIVTDAPIALTPYEVMHINSSFSSFTIEFDDTTNLDYENTVITLSGPNEQEIFTTLEESDDSKYIVRFVALTESGLYTISVTPQDNGGNVAQSSTQYQFRLDIAGPSVQSVSIDGKLGSAVYVSNSSPRIIASFTDALGVGLSFGENGTDIVVTNSDGLQIPGTATSNDSNQLIWIPIPFATDGSADGQYNVAVTPVDMNGRSGTVVNRMFIYDSQAPRITDATPITLHAPVSYIGSGLSEFVLTIQDEGPAGFVLSSQVAALMDASNRPIPASITHNELTDQLFLTLSAPFANDGSADGTYTLNVALTDKAGNRKNSRYTVVYDSRVPQIAAVHVNTVGIPKELLSNEVTELSESISTITISFSEATRVDFENTDVSLFDPSDLLVPISIQDNGVSEMTVSFPNLTEIGQYILSVTPQDIAGNTASSPIEFSFNLEFILPTVESILIGDTVTLSSGDIAYVNADNLLIIANLLDPADTGLSFDALTGSDILVSTLDGSIVFGSISTNNADVIAWEPITLSTDGSSDGRYAVYVTPVDKHGREGSTIYREFILDTQEPEITSASPINLSQPVSYISESLTQLQFTVQDVGPAALLLEDQQVSLRNQNGTIIPTKLTNDNQNQLYLTLDEPLPLDGSLDGEYTVVIEFADKAGNMLSVEHPIIYDTQAPTIVSTIPGDGELLTEDLTQIVVNLNDEGESGIDWTLTTVTLVDPNDTEISGEVSSNGKTQLTLNTNQLVADGRYIIRVQAIDRAGNGTRSVFQRSFLLSRRLPAVISTTPLTAPEDEAYTNESVEEIVVMLETVDDRHLSTVRLLNADGQVIAGQQQRQSDRLIYQLIRPLATDGSDDGFYTIEFTPISSSGRSGEVQNLDFTYDTQVPELIPDDIQLIVAEPEINNSLVEIRTLLTDNQAGIDWENLADEWFTFEQLTPVRNDIPGKLSYDGEQNILIFRLTVPLADNGSADGEYTISVNPVDKAGNGDETYVKEFTYDTSPPVIDPGTLLLNGAPLLTDRDAVDYPSAISTTSGVVVQASITDAGLGVNLSQSSITIRNPNGQEISGTSQQNGIDTIVFKSDGLNIEGIYEVTITGTGNDSELLGFSPKDSITAAFLYETTEPTGSVINDGGKAEFTDEAIPFEGTAADPQGTRRAGQQGENEVPIPASGVLLVEIVGTGPDGQEIEPVPAEDDSDAQAEPWSTWSVDFLPTRSGEYDLDLRVTDKAGNYTVYDIGEYTMSVSFSFKGKTFGWPNPLRKSKDGVAFFSFDLNAPEDEAIDMSLFIYDWGGDLVYKQKYANITTGERDDTRIKWNLENQAGNAVARGIYVFRLEAVNAAGNRANAVGKVLVVD